MSRYVLKRLFSLIPVLFGVVTAVFLLAHLIPGDPVDIMLGETAQPAQKEELRKYLKLDLPLHEQYLEYLKGLSSGNLGTSIRSRKPVIEEILLRFPATLELAIASIIVAILISFPAGIIAAIKRDTSYDHGSLLFSLIGLSMPNFWLGPLLILVFSIKLDLLPVSGRAGIAHIILPALTMGFGMAAILTRLIRSSMLDELTQDYVRTAVAKGVKKRRVVLLHILKNSMIPVLTVLGLQFGALLAGSIITETIFSWPGIGRLTIHAINSRDYPLVQGCVLFIALFYVLVNLVTDLVYGLFDPRIRYE
ncbi:MAG: ABC transporter permease subunit [Deltaproteobacteria bacterium]|nr:ABC transporter permease subunit [Deltaproteobacteria bacterium]NIS77428.1 ABC transporter permease subunit [Deltaproteobacteria bacterium]